MTEKTTENLKAKLQHASGPLLPLTELLLHQGDCTDTVKLKPKAQDNITPLATSYPSECQKLDFILTQLLNAAWDMWQESYDIQQSNIWDLTESSVLHHLTTCTIIITLSSHLIGRHWLEAFLRQRLNTAWDWW